MASRQTIHVPRKHLWSRPRGHNDVHPFEIGKRRLAHDLVHHGPPQEWVQDDGGGVEHERDVVDKRGGDFRQRLGHPVGVGVDVERCAEEHVDRAQGDVVFQTDRLKGPTVFWFWEPCVRR